MSKKRDFQINYSIRVNGEEYPREYTVRGVTSKAAAETKLRGMCKEEIVITSNEEL